MTAKVGVIEGFFGPAWGWPARKSGIDFLRAADFDFYVYAPKSEAYLRRQWRESMPEKTVASLVDLHKQCRKSKVSLGIGLTPYEIHLNYGAEAKNALRGKVAEINDIGPEILCVLFDDMRGDINGLASGQARVIDDIAVWSTASHLIVCPTYYSSDPRLTKEFGPPPQRYLRDLGRLVDPRIDFFWTGEKVISDSYSRNHLLDVAATIERKPFIWDNSGANDGRARTRHLYLDPAAVAWSCPTDLVSGIAFNPMNEPYLSRIALLVYHELLRQLPAGKTESLAGAACKRLCGAELGKRLYADLKIFQQEGLDGLDAKTRKTLLARYRKFEDNPFATDVINWLDGHYKFDPQCLTA